MPKLTLYFLPPLVLIIIAHAFNFITLMYLFLALASILITLTFICGVNSVFPLTCTIYTHYYFSMMDAPVH